MSGLLAARVLHDHFDSVTLVERDLLPDSAEWRKGVGQGRHAHVLLKRGEQILEALFPGLVPALTGEGAEPFDMGTDLRWHHFGVWKKSFVSGIVGLSMSRPLLEAAVRRRVRELPNLRILDGHDAVAPVASEDRARVIGLTVRRRDGQAEETLPAELLVDASGRGSSAPSWLESLGLGRPAETAVRVRVGYTTRIYRQPARTAHPWRVLYIVGKPPIKRCGLILPVEGGRWMVTLAGYLDDHAPADEAGFMDFARTLSAPDIYEALRDAEPLGEIVTHKFPSSLRRHYDRMTLPEGFVVLGDAACSFNPVFGQGITVGALGAVALGALLAERGSNLDGLSRSFQRRLARIIDTPWSMSTSEDFRFDELTGERPFGTALMNWYVGRVHALTAEDESVASSFFQALHLLSPPALLFRPRILARVLRGPIRT
jgi:2-polyprenyl-6-methoxyphenol hydroxylase-like FAD-dependent oxidoreductase